MMTDLRAGFLLFVALAFFLVIIAVFSLSMVMRPDRWSERTRWACEARGDKRPGFTSAS